MRQEKQLLLDEIDDHIKDANAWIVVKYHGLKAEQATAFRRRLRSKGAELQVVGKRLLKKAAQNAGIEDIATITWDGSLGVVSALEDPITATKEVFEFRKEHEDSIEVAGGFFDGKVYSGKDVEALSKLPSKPEMQAQLLGLFEAPMSQTLAVMESLLTSVIHCIDQKAKQDGEES